MGRGGWGGWQGWILGTGPYLGVCHPASSTFRLEWGGEQKLFGEWYFHSLPGQTLTLQYPIVEWFSIFCSFVVWQKRYKRYSLTRFSIFGFANQLQNLMNILNSIEFCFKFGETFTIHVLHTKIEFLEILNKKTKKQTKNKKQKNAALPTVCRIAVELCKSRIRKYLHVRLPL
jgi:hypothetical protein